jgi:hypothetical protein
MKANVKLGDKWQGKIIEKLPGGSVIVLVERLLDKYCMYGIGDQHHFAMSSFDEEVKINDTVIMYYNGKSLRGRVVIKEKLES